MGFYGRGNLGNVPRSGPYRTVQDRIACLDHYIYSRCSSPVSARGHIRIQIGTIQLLIFTKNSHSCRDLNPGPLRYQADMLPT